jgi:nucleoside-diphosphate-sugar epimerase
MTIRHHHAAPQSPARVVVIGASGFVGGDLVRRLQAASVPVVALSSKDVNLLDEGCVDQLLHLARPGDALVLVSALTPDRGRDVATLMRNLKMAEHVAAFLGRAALAHLVYVSSDAVYPDGANPVTEATPCHPASFHGLMHLAREQILGHEAARAKTPYLVLRPTLIYDARDTHNGYGPNRFLRTAARERKITLFGHGEEKRDHLYIDDLGRLTVHCLEHRSEGVLNVATGASASFHDVARLVCGLCPHPVAVECLPRGTPITHRHFDVTAALKAFPTFRFTTLAEGLAASYQDLAVRAAA